MNNCGSCIYAEQDCEYERFKKDVELHIYDGMFEDVLELRCSKYKRRKINKLKYSQKLSE